MDNTICLDQQYADDIGWISNSKSKIDHINATIPDQLKDRKLIIKDSKTEYYNISRAGNSDWKKCKYFGSYIGTDEDINRRKQLAIISFNKYKDILTSKIISLKTRVRLFNVYVTSIFMYNSELWYVSCNIINIIDTFHRNLLR